MGPIGSTADVPGCSRYFFRKSMDWANDSRFMTIRCVIGKAPLLPSPCSYPEKLTTTFGPSPAACATPVTKVSGGILLSIMGALLGRGGVGTSSVCQDRASANLPPCLTTVPRRNTRQNGVQAFPRASARGFFFNNPMAHGARQPSAAHHGTDTDAGTTGCIPGQASGPLTNVPTRFHFCFLSAAAAASKSRAMRASSQASLAAAQVWCVSSIHQLSLPPNRGFKRVSGEFSQ